MSSVWMFLPFHKRSLTDDSDLYNACSKCIHNDFKAAAMLQHRSTFTYISSENRFRTFCSAGRDVWGIQPLFKIEFWDENRCKRNFFNLRATSGPQTAVTFQSIHERCFRRSTWSHSEDDVRWCPLIRLWLFDANAPLSLSDFGSLIQRMK